MADSSTQRSVTVADALAQLPGPDGQRFEDFTDDLVVWVLFYGPECGETP